MGIKVKRYIGTKVSKKETLIINKVTSLSFVPLNLYTFTPPKQLHNLSLGMV